MDLELSLQGRVLKNLLLFTFLEHLDIFCFQTGVLLPCALIRGLLPLDVLHPSSCIGFVGNWHPALGNTSCAGLLFFQHEVGISLV